MPLFLVEREYAEQLELTDTAITATAEIYDSAGVAWITSFLSADKKKTYCLYEAPSVEALREASARADFPAEAIVEVSKYGPQEFA